MWSASAPTTAPNRRCARRCSMRSTTSSKAAHKAVVVLLSGVATGGRGETAMKLSEWMDPRHLRVLAFGPRSPEELAHPPAWRYWQALPPRGRISVFMNAWYAEAMQARVSGQMDDAALDAQLHAIRDYERMMPQEDVLLVKFWIHLSKSAQKARLASSTGRRPRPGASPTATGTAPGSTRSHARCGNTRCAKRPPGKPPGTSSRAPTRATATSPSAHPARIADAGQRRGGREDPAPAAQPATTAPAVVDNVKLIRDLDLDAEDRRPNLRTRARAAAGPAREAHATQALRAALAGAGVRGYRRRRQGRRDPARRGGARSAAIHDRARRRADRRGEGASLPLAVLAPGAATGRHHDLRPLLVRPRAGRACRGLLRGGGLDARVRGDQPLRGAPRPRRHRRRASSGCRSARPSSSPASARGRRFRSSGSRSRPTTGATASAGPTTSARSRTWSTARQHRARAVDAGRGRRQALRAASRSCRPSSTASSAALGDLSGTRGIAVNGAPGYAAHRGCRAGMRRRSGRTSCRADPSRLPARTGRHARRRLLGFRLAGRRRRADARRWSSCSTGSRAARARITHGRC